MDFDAHTSQDGRAERHSRSGLEPTAARVLYARLGDRTAALAAVQRIRFMRRGVVTQFIQNYPQLDYNSALQLFCHVDMPEDYVWVPVVSSDYQFNPMLEHRTPTQSRVIASPAMTSRRSPVPSHSRHGPYNRLHRSTGNVQGRSSRPARPYIRCRVPGCSRRGWFRTRRGLREHLILKHAISELLARVQTENAFREPTRVHVVQPDETSVRVQIAESRVPRGTVHRPIQQQPQGQESDMYEAIGAQFPLMIDMPATDTNDMEPHLSVNEPDEPNRLDLSPFLHDRRYMSLPMAIVPPVPSLREDLSDRSSNTGAVEEEPNPSATYRLPSQLDHNELAHANQQEDRETTEGTLNDHTDNENMDNIQPDMYDNLTSWPWYTAEP